MDQTVRYTIVSVSENGTWEFTAMIRAKDGFWYSSCSEGMMCRMCPFSGGGCSPRLGSMSFPSKETAVLCAAAMDVEVWGCEAGGGVVPVRPRDEEVDVRETDQTVRCIPCGSVAEPDLRCASLSFDWGEAFSRMYREDIVPMPRLEEGRVGAKTKQELMFKLAEGYIE